MSSPTAKVASVVINCQDVDRLVTFWTEMLGLEERQRYPGFVWLSPMTEGGPALAFQQVPEEKPPGRNRLHFNMSVDDREAFITFVEGLGGSRVDDHEIQGFHWTIMADPEGNEFCIAESH